MKNKIQDNTDKNQQTSKFIYGFNAINSNSNLISFLETDTMILKFGKAKD